MIRRVGSPESRRGQRPFRHGLRTGALLACGLLLCWPTAAQPVTQAEWDAAYASAYRDPVPYLDGPWNPQSQPDPGGVFGDVFAWNAHFIVRGYVSMAQTYGGTSYLDRAVTLIDEMLLQRDDRRVARGELDLAARPYVNAPLFYLQPENRDKGAKGWHRIWDNQVRVEAVVDGQICDAIMRFVDLVGHDNRFEAYRSHVSRYVADVTETIAMHDENFVFDRFPDVPGIYYWSNPNGSGLFAGGIPLNQNFVILRAALLLDKANGTTVHRAKAVAFLEYFWSQATLTQGRYVWDYDPRGASTPPEDINHGAIDVTFLVLAHDLGLVSHVRMERLARTFTENLYRGDGDTARFVDGTGDEFSSFDAGIGWIELAEFDPRVWRMATEVLLEDYPVPTWSDPLLAWAEIQRFWGNIGGTLPLAPEDLQRDDARE